MQARNVHAPQLGFNNNVRHNGQVFHIQTEDSGVNHPHITTHLFADGGRILRTERTDYKELLASPHLAALLRQRMKEQHRAMFMALREGKLDHLINATPTRSGSSQSGPTVAAEGVATRAAAPDTTLLDSAAPQGASSSPAAPQAATANGGRSAPSASRPSAAPERAPVAARPAVPTSRNVTPSRSVTPRAPATRSAPARASTTPRAPNTTSKRPPAPARARASAAPRARAPASPGEERLTPTQAKAPIAKPVSSEIAEQTTTSLRASASSSGGHVAPARPSLQGSNQVSIFGTARVQEQSLDDIILSYISEDLEGE